MKGKKISMLTATFMEVSDRKDNVKSTSYDTLEP